MRKSRGEDVAYMRFGKRRYLIFGWLGGVEVEGEGDKGLANSGCE